MIPITAKPNVRVTTTAIDRQRWLREGPPPASLRLLDVMHGLGCNCTVAQLADQTGTSEYSVREYVRPLLWAGYVTSERRANPYTDGGSCAYFIPVRDTQGRLCKPAHDARPAAARPVKPRTCNRCRQTFQPEHRFNFRCAPCDYTVRRSEEYNAAPGMEMIA